MSQFSRHTNNHKTETELIPSACWGKSETASTELIKANFHEIEKQVAHCKPRIIGVTKYYGLNAIIEGYEAGLRDFGESRVIEAAQKIEALPEEIRKNSTFHFIGHLQTNKAEKAVEYFDYIHSVDSLKLAQVISKAACRLNKKEKVLLQVNNSEEEQKSGYDEKTLKEELPQILSLESIEVVGLMNMARLGATEQELRKVFRGLRELRDRLQAEFNIQLPELSMGMSNDYNIAVEEGATIIRIGRKLFS